MTKTQTTQWAGPLPPPEALEKFNNIIPNGAARIVAMAEKEQSHRIAIESSGQTANIGEARRGQLLGAGLSALCILSTLASVAIDAHYSVSLALIGVPLVSTIRAIINRKTSPKPKA